MITVRWHAIVMSCFPFKHTNTQNSHTTSILFKNSTNRSNNDDQTKTARQKPKCRKKKKKNSEHKKNTLISHANVIFYGKHFQQ